MSRALSIYLDAVRFGTAMLIFLTHLAYPRFTGGVLEPLRVFGNDGVMIFFVLSGFIISYTSSVKDGGFGSYMSARLTRVYSVALPAMVLTVVLDAIGTRLDPVIYDGFWYRDDRPVYRFFMNLFFTNQMWFASLRPFSNGPYWSLAYEVWYYVLFGAAFYLRGDARLRTLVLVSIFVGPKILLLMPVWLLGVAAHRFIEHVRLPVTTGWALVAGTIAAYAGLKVAGVDAALLEATRVWLGQPFVDYKLTWSDQFLWSYLLGALVALNFIGFASAARSVAHIPVAVEGWIRWAAGATFSMYLFHYPLLQVFGAAYGGYTADPLRLFAITGSTLVAVFALAELTERRKDEFRSFVGRLRVRQAELLRPLTIR